MPAQLIRPAPAAPPREPRPLPPPRAGSNLLVPPLPRRAGGAPWARLGGPADKGGAAAAQGRPPPPAAGPGGAGGQRGAGALAQDGGGAAGERAPLVDAAAAAPAPGARRGLHGAGGPALSLLLRPGRPGCARWVRKEGGCGVLGGSVSLIPRAVAGGATCPRPLGRGSGRFPAGMRSPAPTFFPAVCPLPVAAFYPLSGHSPPSRCLLQ